MSTKLSTCIYKYINSNQKNLELRKPEAFFSFLVLLFIKASY